MCFNDQALGKIQPKYVGVYKSLPLLVIETNAQNYQYHFIAILCAKISSVCKAL